MPSASELEIRGFNGASWRKMLVLVLVWGANHDDKPGRAPKLPGQRPPPGMDDRSSFF